jgi:hypothetical protein
LFSTVLEQRVNATGEILFRLDRNSVRNDLRLAKMMAAMGLADVTEDEVDEVLDES